MENGLLFDQTGPVGTLTPLAYRAERLDDLSHSRLSKGGDLLSTCRLDRLPSGRVRDSCRSSRVCSHPDSLSVEQSCIQA